jgi:hypothetical protein
MITAGQTGILAVLFFGTLVGKSIGAQQAILTGFIVLGLLAPTNFPLTGMALIFLCVVAKWGAQWVRWL